MAALVGPVARLHAEQLPFRHYGIAEGHTGTNTRAIRQDSRGYLWFGSDDGLSRFDGYRFVNYGVRDGVGNPSVNVIAEDRNGQLWVGTNGAGVARLIEERLDSSAKEAGGRSAGLKFVTYTIGESRDSNRVNDMAFDADGTLWCATDHGLYRRAAASLEFEPVLTRGPFAAATPLLLDSRGRLWAAFDKELILFEHGRVTRWEPPEGVTEHRVSALAEDRKGRILAANDFGLYEYRPAAAGEGPGSWRRLPLTLGPLQKIRSVWAGPDGVLWIATSQGLIKYLDGSQSVYTTAHGLKSDVTSAVLGDREGSLWVGTNAGPVRLQGLGAVGWTKADGLPDETIHRVIEAQDGRIYVSTARGGFAEIVGGKVVPIPGSKDPPLDPVVDGMPTQVLQDRHGDWWVTTRTAVYLFQGPSLQFRHGRRFGTADGIPEGALLSGGTDGIHEDPAGKVWIGSPLGLFRFDPSKRRRPFDLVPRAGFDQGDEVCNVVGDRSGTIWLASHAELARVVDGRMERVQPHEAPPAPMPLALFADSRGRLWVGLRQGVWMTSDPGARQPRWTRYSRASGLSSDRINAITEDHLGRIYLGNPSGLDRLELDTGRVRSLTSRDGLAGAYVNHLLTDQRGYLWVATGTGLTRLDPRTETNTGPPPPVYFTHVLAGGEELWLPERGARAIPLLRLGASGNNLLIEYVGLSFRAEGSLRYQYRLDGVDRDWNPPSEQRSVNYARLAPGSYRFLVRAVTPEGQASQEPASFAFEIAPPLWRRWWFLAGAAALLALAAESLQRLRLRRRLELEAVRTRIATDLHDDVGSNLSRIAILSEVARRDLDGGRPAASERLSVIASVSRELVDSMSDIVWAVNPARDRLRDLTHRMRRFADDVLSARDIALRFRAPADGDDVVLGPDLRREVFLVFKEAVNNLARHSGCRGAEIELGLEDGGLALRVRDDGCGFDPRRVAGAGDGNGLWSMRRRAESLGGTLEIASRPGEGTTLALRVPLGRRSRARAALGPDGAARRP